MRRSFVSGIAIAALLASNPAAAQRVEVGNAATVVGDVKMSNASIRTPRKVERRQRLAWGDRIDTGKRSQLQILLLDRSNFGIGANSSVRIDRYVYDPNAGRSVVATFFKGALRFFTGSEGNNNAEVNTPSGRIGIRGTALDLLVGENAREIAEDEDFVDDADAPDGKKAEATLVVLRGPGAATQGGLTVGRAEVEAAGTTVVLDRPGQAAYIPRNGAPPIGPFMISDAALAQIQDQLAPEVARAMNDGGFFEDLLPVVGAVAGAAALGAILSGDDNDSGQTTSTGGRTQPQPQGNTTSTNNPNGRPPG